MNKSQAARLVIVGFLSCQAISASAADSYKTMAITLPLLAPTKLEFNLKSHGSLGVEFRMDRESETFTKKERTDNNGDSLMMKSQQMSLLYSQYSNPKMMSGGFWTLGVGYRRDQGEWLQTPSSTQAATGLKLDADGKLQRDIEASGATGHARVGYRYVGESVPFLAGIYVGMRHYQSKFTDKTTDVTAETAQDDLESLQRRLATSLEAGIDIGFSF